MGRKVTLSVNNFSYSAPYQWFRDGISIGSTSVPSLDVDIEGTYWVEVTKNSSPSAASNNIKVQKALTSQLLNYVIVNNVQVSNVKTIAQVDALSSEANLQQVQYFDGLGRVIQTVQTQGSPDKQDLVVPVQYDPYGRELRKYLPFVKFDDGRYKGVVTDANGAFIGAAADFYNNSTDKVADDLRPFSETTFENSPLGRVEKVFGPGAIWFNNNKFGEVRELLNDFSSEQVVIWNVDSLGNLSRLSSYNNGFYPSGALTVNQVKDEDGNITRTYKNREGLTVLIRRLTGASSSYDRSNWNDTYYIYDLFGALTYVLQPELSFRVQQNSTYIPSETELEQYAFKYVYDFRRRLVEKRVPGAKPQYFIYDNRDRLVLTQDGEQRKRSEWLFTKYDELNRPVLTGKYNSAGTRASIQNLVNNFYSSLSSGQGWFEIYQGSSGVIQGYSNRSFPQEGNVSNYLSVQYYDSNDSYNTPAAYGYVNEGLTDPVTSQVQQPVASLKTQALPVATMVKDLSSGSWLRTVSYFDEKYRPIQVITDHIKGRLVTSNVVDFVGKILVSRRKYSLTSMAPTQVTVNESNKYDHAGRLIWTKHSINGSSAITVAQNEYNAIGQLVDKKLHSSNGTSFAQSVDFRYNVRGWLTRINNADVGTMEQGDDLFDYFGLELTYGQAFLGGIANFNGNISSLQWSKGNGGTVRKQAYNYSYDKLNRLLIGEHYDYSAGWVRNNGRFDEGQAYDRNGNITKLKRNGFVSTIDSLNFGYLGNRLVYVHDSADPTLGFKNGNVGIDDFSYDDNGNMVSDKNKSLSSVAYNHLNLVSQVQSGAGTLTYAYDAAGRKLQKVAGSKVTDYFGELIFENNNLQMVSFADGRILPDGTNWEYQYFLKDHLGSVHVTFTTKVQQQVCLNANFETASQSTESQTFQNYSATNFDLVDHTDAGTVYQRVQWLNGGVNGRVGLAKSIPVMPGDQVSISAYGKYMNLSSTGNPTALITSLAAAFGVSSGSIGEQGKIYQGLNSFASSVPNGTHQGDDGSAPKAFVTILFFDKNYNLIDAAWDQMSNTGAQTSGTIKQPHDLLSISAKAPEAGYAYVFLSNEHPTYVDVYYDDVSLCVTPSPIVAVNDYYPYGLTFNDGTREGSLDQKFKFNGKEQQAELGMDWLDFGARMYMPEIGRWGAIDPLAEKYRRWSPYNYAVDNPVRYIDPDGMEVVEYKGAAARAWFINHQMRQTMKKIQQRYEGPVSIGVGSGEGEEKSERQEDENAEEEGAQQGWSPLYKSDLEAYAESIGYCTNCTSNQLGNLFEDIFEGAVGPAGVAAHFRRNGNQLFSLSDRNTKPDFTADAYYHETAPNGSSMPSFPRRITIAQGTWYEVKAMYGNLYASSNEGQIKGHIDNLYEHTAGVRNQYPGFTPGLYIITTADVRISRTIFNHAAGRVNVYQAIAEYKISNGVYQFRFK